MFAEFVVGGDGGGGVQGVVFNCVGRGGVEKRALRGWGTAAQSS